MLAISGAEKQQVRQALTAARLALAAADVPVGACVFDPAGRLVSRGHNTREATGEVSGHAEIMALNAASAATGSRVLEGYTLAVTLEPCAMCAGAILASRVSRVVFGAWDDKAGAAGSVYDLLRDGRLPHPVPEVIGGVLESECAKLLHDFFAARR